MVVDRVRRAAVRVAGDAAACAGDGGQRRLLGAQPRARRVSPRRAVDGRGQRRRAALARPWHVQHDQGGVRRPAEPGARRGQDPVLRRRGTTVAQRLAVLCGPRRRRPRRAPQPARTAPADVLLPDGRGSARAARLCRSPLHRRLPVPAADQRAAARAADVVGLRGRQATAGRRPRSQRLRGRRAGDPPGRPQRGLGRERQPARAAACRAHRADDLRADGRHVSTDGSRHRRARGPRPAHQGAGAVPAALSRRRLCLRPVALRSSRGAPGTDRAGRRRVRQRVVVAAQHRRVRGDPARGQPDRAERPRAAAHDVGRTPACSSPSTSYGG